MIRRAFLGDLDILLEIVKETKLNFKKEGLNQWQEDDYPSAEVLRKDIEKKQLYVYEDNGQVVAMLVISIDENLLDYKNIEGTWINSDLPYAGTHRLAIKSGYKKKGLASKLIELAKTLARANKMKSIKIDTHKDNLKMRNLLKKNGFVERGIIYLDQIKDENHERIAYEFIIRPAYEDKKLVIFDLDGTLVESTYYWERAAKVAFETVLSKRGRTLDENLRALHIQTIIAKTFEGDKEGREEFMQLWYQIMEEEYYKQVPLKPHAKETLQYFKNKGYKIALATTTREYFARKQLKHLNVDKYFDLIATVEVVRKSKNHPDLFNYVLKYFGVEAKDAVIFEDSLYAIKTARNIGIDVVGVIEDEDLEFISECSDYLNDYTNYLE